MFDNKLYRPEVMNVIEGIISQDHEVCSVSRLKLVQRVLLSHGAGGDDSGSLQCIHLCEACVLDKTVNFVE